MYLLTSLVYCQGFYCSHSTLYCGWCPRYSSSSIWQRRGNGRYDWGDSGTSHVCFVASLKYSLERRDIRESEGEKILSFQNLTFRNSMLQSAHCEIVTEKYIKEYGWWLKLPQGWKRHLQFLGLGKGPSKQDFRTSKILPDFWLFPPKCEFGKSNMPFINLAKTFPSKNQRLTLRTPEKHPALSSFFKLWIS